MGTYYTPLVHFFQEHLTKFAKKFALSYKFGPIISILKVDRSNCFNMQSYQVGPHFAVEVRMRTFLPKHGPHLVRITL